MADPTPEQIKEFQEKLKDMSPEEIKELQKQQCIFCKIISGEVQSKKVYDDEFCIAVLDINPANPGHLLLIPKEHYPLFPLIPPEIIAHLGMVSKALSHVLLNQFGAEGTNIFIANGGAAGQRAQHFMMHIIPRKETDSLPFTLPENKMPQDQFDNLVKILSSNLKKMIPSSKLIQQPPKETPKETPKEIPKEIPKEPSNDSETFITSETAKRFHKSTCPFAQNIPEEKRIYWNEEEANNSEKKPCTCITGKKIPKGKKSKSSTKIPKKSESPKIPEKTKISEKVVEKEEDVSLDDIADLFK